MKPRRLDYCHFLIVTQINYTQTYFADHHATFSHDAINRYLKNDYITPSVVWSSIKNQITYSPHGYLIFDDTVLDKRHSSVIEGVRRQYSGNEKGVIKGLGVVNCVYVNPETEASWIIDWRLYAPETDGKTKLDHVQEMFDNAILHKQLPFQTVLMDSWYATKDLMLHIDRAGKLFYCPLKNNRLVDDSGGQRPYQAISSLTWTPDELEHGKLIKIKAFPGNKKVKLFRVVVTSHRTDWVVTNDLSQNSTDDTQKVCAVRWKIEQYHREVKQTLGIERCQCRSLRAQKNHIGCVILAWHQVTAWVRKQKTNIYAFKSGLLSDYMRGQLKTPILAFTHT